MSNMDAIQDILTDIKDNIANQNFDNINQDFIINMGESTILLLLNEITDIILNNNHYKYKYSHYENTVKLMVDIIIKCNKNNKKIDLMFNNLLILRVISYVNNSHIYLRKMKNIIKSNKYYNIELLLDVSLKSTMPVFLFWWNLFFKNLTLSIVHYIQLLSNSLINPDDRIYQFILEQKSVASPEDIYTTDNKILIVNDLVQSVTMPRKYIQKRLKTLSLKTDLSDILNSMLQNTHDIKVKQTLLTYYYKSELSFDTISNIVVNCIFDFNSAISIYHLLKTEEEKYVFALVCNLNGYYHQNMCIVNIKNNILNENREYILDKLIFQFNIIYENNKFSVGLDKIFNYYKTNKALDNYILKNFSISNSIDLIKYTKFFILPNNTKPIFLDKNIRINKCLHILRCFLKKYANNKYNNFNYKFKPIINEVKNFKPNNKVQILNKGSLNYQLNFQKYNTVPPRHLLPLENILHKNYLVKEKADGILISSLPTKIIPLNNDIYSYEIKAEFIEDLNLYLIFDINIPNTTILERQHYLRSLHPETANIPYTPFVTTADELINEIKKERGIFKHFMEANQNSDFKWYPKGSWKLFMNENIYTNIINIIESNNVSSNNLNNVSSNLSNDLSNDFTETILNGEFNCDGLILSPLDGKRELKIKPKKLQTIDLLYNGKKWIDSDNKEWDIEKIPNKNYQNKVYRCYPNNNKYIATEIRYDKKKPNSSKIIDQILNIYKFNWLGNIDLLVNKDKYYELIKKVYNNDLINILSYQKNLLATVIKEIKPEINKNWLDLGCGKCKLYYLIKDEYSPRKYLGIDNDAKILSNKYNIVDENNDIVNLYPANLNNKWDEVNLWNSFDWSIKYDYIIANFSIMHFFSELFWEQLNKVTKKGSIFIFNVVKKNILWNHNKSYITSNNVETKIYFEWAHTKEHIESIISEEQINNMIEKYNWTIKYKIEYNKPLSDCYDWYIIVKE